MESKNINLIPENEAVIYHASLNDDDRVIRCNLYDGANVITLTGAESLRLRYKLPDGTANSISVTNTSNSYVDITIPDSLTKIVGRVYCKLRMDNVGFKAFYIEVERGV